MASLFPSVSEGPNQPRFFWHILQYSDVLDREFALALAEQEHVVLWQPRRSFLPWLHHSPGKILRSESETLQIRQFPIMFGYGRFPGWLLPYAGTSPVRYLEESGSDPLSSSSYPLIPVLVCTTPYFAHVAERWKGPVVYWLTDRIVDYANARQSLVHKLDRRMCRASTLVCPNSERIADYLAGFRCDAERIMVLPNATRAAHLLDQPGNGRTELPEPLQQIGRPVAGVIGNLAGNTDWLWIEQILQRTPWLHWVFVGPYQGKISIRPQRLARQRVLSSANTCFVGTKPPEELAQYARAFDVAVLPYLKRDPTFSGSSTRFYEHLAAGQPMIATRGVHELLKFEPLLRLVGNADEAVGALVQLRDNGFRDEFSHLRWETSLQNTWTLRADALRSALGRRIQGTA